MDVLQVAHALRRWSILNIEGRQEARSAFGGRETTNTMSFSNTTPTKSKYYSGETCPTTGTYGQWSDRTGAYAGAQHDKYVRAGTTFPPSENNHHFRYKG